MWVLNTAGMAIIFALVRSTTSTASGQRWAAKPPNPGGYARPATRPNVHVNSHTPPQAGMTSTMSGQHSLPDSTETMTEDHPEHHHRPRPVMTQKLGPIPKAPLMSGEAASEENTMPLVMTEDHAMMLSEEVQLTNSQKSDESMIEEMSEHDKVISVHEFKEVLHELGKNAVNKIVMKKAGIMGKLKTAKQNLIAHNGEATGRNPQQLSPNRVVDNCQCDPNKFDKKGRGNCNTNHNGKPWCYLDRFSVCHDEKPSVQFRGIFWSQSACDMNQNPCGRSGLSFRFPQCSPFLQK